MLDPTTSSQGVPLPTAVRRYTTGPQGLVVCWTVAGAPLDGLVGRLEGAGYLPVVVDPADTADVVEHAGAPSALVVDPVVLTAPVLDLLRAFRLAHPHASVGVLASESTPAAGLLAAMRAGLTDVVDPAADDVLHRLFPDTLGGGARVLAVGAHPDDVEIGCGATLLRHRDLGHPVSVLTLSQGAVGGQQEERRREAAAAAAHLGAELLLGDFTDTRIEHDETLIATITDVVAAVAPTVVYVHSQADNHQDHRAVHEATVIAARRVPELYCYQSPSSRNAFAPTKFVPVDDTVEEKVRLLEHYRSQSARPYLAPDLVTASCRYWARQLTDVRHAEPFEVMRAAGAG